MKIDGNEVCGFINNCPDKDYLMTLWHAIGGRIGAMTGVNPCDKVNPEKVKEEAVKDYRAELRQRFMSKVSQENPSGPMTILDDPTDQAMVTEVSTPLTPVGVDTDGTVKPIDQLSEVVPPTPPEQPVEPEGPAVEPKEAEHPSPPSSKPDKPDKHKKPEPKPGK